MSGTDELLKNNERFAASFRGGPATPPARGVAVIACMDARLNVYAILGLAEGDAHVIRNAGGVITDDGIRSLAISQRLLGTTEIILVHHTDCGMLTFTDDAFRASIEAETGIKPPWAAEAFGDLDASLRQSMARIRASPFLPHTDAVRGFVFDVGTGRLREVSLRRDQRSGVSPWPCCSARNRSNWAPSSSAVGMSSGWPPSEFA
jgi:carbonic anhydrase